MHAGSRTGFSFYNNNYITELSFLEKKSGNVTIKIVLALPTECCYKFLKLSMQADDAKYLRLQRLHDQLLSLYSNMRLDEL